MAARQGQARAVFVRLKVEDADKAIAELRRLGIDGETSLRKVDSASRRAATAQERFGRALTAAKTRMVAFGSTLGPQIAMFANWRTALATVAGTGGLGLLARRALETADHLDDVANKLGLNVEHLQEWLYAANQAGIASSTFEMAMQRFGRRVAEAAEGTGEAKDVLAELGIPLRDTSGQVRTLDELLLDLADALDTSKGSLVLLRQGFKLFDSEGVIAINLLKEGRQAIMDYREDARRLGIVMSASMIEKAQRANDRMKALGSSVRASFDVGFIDGFVDSFEQFADRAESSGLQQSVKSIGEELGGLFALIIDNADLIARLFGVLAGARIGSLAGPWGTAGGALLGGLSPELLDLVTGTTDRLQELRAELERLEQKTAMYPGIEIWKTRIAEIRGEIRSIESERAALLSERSRRLTMKGFATAGTAADPGSVSTGKADDAAAKQAARLAEANRELVATMQAELAALGMSERARFIDTALRRLNAEATDAERARVRALAGAMFDEQQAAEAAAEAARALKAEEQKRQSLIESLLTPQERFNRQLEEARILLDGTARGSELYQRRVAQLREELAKAGEETRKGIDPAEEFADVLTRGFDDAVSSGKDLATVLADVDRALADLIFRITVMEPLEGALRGLFGGGEGKAGTGGFSLPGTFSGPTGAQGGNFLTDLVGQAGSWLFGGGSSTGGTGRAGGTSGGAAAAAGVGGTGSSSFFSSLFSFFSLFGFAQGGQATGGIPILVGERGPEIFRPSTSGEVVPNHRMGGGPLPVTIAGGMPAAGGGPQINQTITLTRSDGGDFGRSARQQAREVGRQTLRALEGRR